MKTHLVKRLIKEKDLDFYGHVNHARYLDILEQARWDLLEESGFGMSVINESKKGPVVLDLNIKYLRELSNRTQIEIETTLSPFKGKLGKIFQKIFINKSSGKSSDTASNIASDRSSGKSSERKLSCEVSILYGLMDLKKRKLIEPPDSWLKLVNEYSES